MNFRNRDNGVRIVMRDKPIICEELSNNFSYIFFDVLISVKEEASKAIRPKIILLVKAKDGIPDLLNKIGDSEERVSMISHKDGFVSSTRSLSCKIEETLNK